MSKRKRKSKRIDRATRDAAATLCLLMAEYWITSSNEPSPAMCEDNESVESLSQIAWLAVCRAFAEASVMDAELEAAGLLLDGWCPGDRVELLRAGGDR